MFKLMNYGKPTGHYPLKKRSLEDVVLKVQNYIKDEGYTSELIYNPETKTYRLEIKEKPDA